MIGISKKYQLRNGWEVDLYAIKEGQDYPVLGALKDTEDGAWKPACWTLHGLYLGDRSHRFDLVEIRPRIKRTVWLNVYSGSGASMPHYSKADADTGRSGDCLACVKIEIDCEEGEGL